MKKLGVLFIAFLLISVLSFSLSMAADDLAGVPGGSQIQNAGNTVSGITKTIEEKKWDYLSEQWKVFFLQNKYVYAADGFFKSIDLVFVALLGEHYDLSLTLLFTFALWVFFFFAFGRIFKDFSTFSGSVSYVLAFAIAVIAAQTGVYRGISVFIFKIIFFKEGIWRWVGFVAFIVLYAGLLTYLKWTGKFFKDMKKKRLESRQKMDQKVLRKTVEGIEEGEE